MSPGIGSRTASTPGTSPTNPAPRGGPHGAGYQDGDAAENTSVHTTTDSQHPLPRETGVLLYKAGNGDRYRLSTICPGKGHFTEQGRETADTACATLGIDNP